MVNRTEVPPCDLQDIVAMLHGFLSSFRARWLTAPDGFGDVLPESDCANTHILLHIRT